MKESLLKWAYHLNKGTTWGYATRKDCLVVFGFSILLYIVYAVLYYLIGFILNVQDEILDEYLKFIYLMFYVTIIADISLMFMRINDICGKRCFTTKGRILAFLVIYFLLTEGFGGGILETVFGIKPIIDTKGWLSFLIYFIFCIYPSSSKEREEMPIVEYKLPTEFVTLLLFMIVVASGLLFYEVTKVAESKVEVTETETGTITDERDGKVYKTVKIGKQTWMAENLNYNDPWRIGKCYNNEPSNCEIYGKLYDWETAMKICPRGWRLPSYDEWDTLYQSIGGKDYYTDKVETKLKAENGWEKNNGTDDYGFTALPGGLSIYLFNEKKYQFGLFGINGIWWTATQEPYEGPQCWLIGGHRFYPDWTTLMSVRCVKN